MPSTAGPAGPTVLRDPASRVVYASDNSIYQVEPAAIALPTSAAEVAALVAENHARPEPLDLVARGGGTGTNGQSLTNGLVIDCKRHLNRIVSIDPEARTAVVEPGVVTAALNAELAASGLFWAPHTATLNRATVGGMIATDAAGKGSLIHGRAHRHVHALDVVLDDGTPWRAEALTVAAATERATVDDRIGRLWRALLDLAVAEGADYGLPSLARGFSGYGIDRVRRGDLIDPVPLLCGSEGTLALTTAATLRLTPTPSHTVLVVASYRTFDEALLDAVDLAVTKPTAIETFDETTLDRGRFSPAWPALAAAVGDETGSVLLLEYSGEAEIDLEPIVGTLQRTGRSQASRAVRDPDERAAAWKVRADAVGLLAKIATGGPYRSARPTAFVEDCAVPVREMPDFIAGFRRILDDAGLTYGMFGHADVGCVHVRPALDLTDPEHETMVRRITEAVTELVASHGGVLWGEHGRGFRGEVAPSFLSEETLTIMRTVKAAFDPRDLLNPGKLYRPTGAEAPLISLDEPTTRGEINRTVPLTIRQEFDTAFACNGNGLCLQYDKRDVMCPSFTATGDPALSPRGRADLIRAWLARRASGSLAADEADDDFDDAVAANLDQCLSCSACAGQCPVSVDIPELKSRFFEQYYATRRRPPSHRLLSRFEQLAATAALVPGPLGRLGGGLTGKALGLVDLPMPPRRPQPFEARRFHAGVGAGTGESGTDLVILPDVFTRTLEPETLSAALRVLDAVGYRVAMADFVPSGKFDHVKGNRRGFARFVAAQQRVLDDVLASGAVPVVIEPAVSLLHDHEYPTAIDGYPAGTVRNLAQVLDDRLDRVPAATTPTRVTLLGHCTEQALAPTWSQAWVRILGAAGHDVTAPRVGCCGMAGIFGHEEANQAVSRRLFDEGWAHHVGGDARVVATGYSCRSQSKRFGGTVVDHPVRLL